MSLERRIAALESRVSSAPRFVPPPVPVPIKAVDLADGSVETAKIADESVTLAKLDAEAAGLVDVVVVSDGGVSSSGAATTKVAEVEAPVGSVLVGIVGIGTVAASTNTDLKFIATYDDDSTLEYTTVASQEAVLQITNGGLLAYRPTNGIALAFHPFTRPVRKIRLETAGTGTAARGGNVAARVVPE